MAKYKLVNEKGDTLETQNMSWRRARLLNQSGTREGEVWLWEGRVPGKLPDAKLAVSPAPMKGAVSTKDIKGQEMPDLHTPPQSQEEAVKKRQLELEKQVSDLKTELVNTKQSLAYMNVKLADKESETALSIERIKGSTAHLEITKMEDALELDKIEADTGKKVSETEEEVLNEVSSVEEPEPEKASTLDSDGTRNDTPEDWVEIAKQKHEKKLGTKEEGGKVEKSD